MREGILRLTRVLAFLAVLLPGTLDAAHKPPNYLKPGVALEPPARQSTVSVDPEQTTTLALSLDDSLIIGLKQSRQVKILEGSLEASLHGFRVVEAGYHPSFTSSFLRDFDDREHKVTQRLGAGGNLSLNHRAPLGGPRVLTANLSQTLTVLSDPSLQQAGLGWARSQLDYLQGIEDFKFSVIQKFFEVLLGQELLLSQEESILRTADLVEIARAKFELGLSSKLDLLNTQVIQGRATTAAIEQRARLQLSIDELRDLIGIEPLIPLSVHYPIEFKPLARDIVDGFRRDLEGQKVDVRIAQSVRHEGNLLARPDIRLNVDHTDDSFTKEDVAAVTWNYALGGRPVIFDKERRRSLFQVAEVRLRDFTFQVRREKRDILRVLDAREQAVQVAEANLANAQESYEYSRLAFERGMINNIDLRDAQDKLTQARISYVSILIDYITATYRYVKTLGGTL